MLDLTSKTLGLTLARLIVWTEDFKLCMRMMGVLVEACTGMASVSRVSNAVALTKDF